MLYQDWHVLWHDAQDIVYENDESKCIRRKILGNMRTLNTEFGIDRNTFDVATQEIGKLFVTDTRRQHIGSVHFPCNMARRGIFVKDINRFLDNLK